MELPPMSERLNVLQGKASPDAVARYQCSYFEQLRTRLSILPPVSDTTRPEEALARKMAAEIFARYPEPAVVEGQAASEAKWAAVIPWDVIYRLEMLLLAALPDAQWREHATAVLVEYAEVAGAERWARQLEARAKGKVADFLTQAPNDESRAALLELQGELHYLYVTQQALQSARSGAYRVVGWFVFWLFIVVGLGWVLAHFLGHDFPQLLVACAVGAMASCISKLQRLSSMPPALHPILSMQQIEELSSGLGASIAIGTVAAGVVYILGAGGLLAGELFAKFPAPDAVTPPAGTSVMRTLFVIGTANPWEFAKLLFWAFVAGFSERFFLETVNRFTDQANKPAGQ